MSFQDEHERAVRNGLEECFLVVFGCLISIPIIEFG
jgi:hypothetical protein